MSLEETLVAIKDLHVQYFMADNETNREIISRQILNAEENIPPRDLIDFYRQQAQDYQNIDPERSERFRLQAQALSRKYPEAIINTQIIENIDIGYFVKQTGCLENVFETICFMSSTAAGAYLGFQFSASGSEIISALYGGLVGGVLAIGVKAWTYPILRK